MKDYAPPVNQLLTLGKPEKPFGGCVGDGYEHFGFGPQDVAELIAMATDMGLNTADGDAPQVWAPLHAWRALSAIDGLAALDAMLAIHKAVNEETYSDQPGEDLLDLAGRLGAAAVPSLERYLADKTMGDSRNYMASALSKVGRNHPDERGRCVSILTASLERCTENDEALNGFLVAALLDLKAVEAQPVIDRAFAANSVDEFIAGDWKAVHRELVGVKRQPDQQRLQGPVTPVIHPGRDGEKNHSLKAKRKAERQAKKKNRKAKR
jgi:hypothetical protein